jgi:hypothetical protein
MSFFRKITLRNGNKIRIFYGGGIGQCSSPIAPLLGPIKHAIGSILPERRADLNELIDGGTHMEIDGASEDFYIAAHIQQKKVILGVAALERVWAHTYFYLAIADVLPSQPKGVQIDLTSIPEIQPAAGLARWAVECEKNRQRSPWPDGLPRPDLGDGLDAKIAITKLYFLHAVCFLMLHEIGHICRKHPTGNFASREMSYRWEFEADEWAFDFMLGDWKNAGRGEADFTGRCTGVALGLAMLAGVELYHYEAEDNHPTIAERLLRFFERYDPRSVGPSSAVRDFPLYLAIVILQWHFTNANVPFQFTKPYEDTKDYLIAAMRAMAQHKDR